VSGRRRQDSFGKARWYAIRPAANRKPATYRCPLCGGHLPALSEHVLVVPEGDASRRRHAHADCVKRARREGRLPLREDVEPRGRVYEVSGTSQAGAGAVWDAWTDVAGWSGAEYIESAEIDGPFEPGATIRSKAKGLPASELKVTSVERPRLWTDETRSPGLRMTFDHLIEPTDGGSRLTERVLIRGPLAFIVGPLLRRRLEALFAASVAHVAETAER
jgi:hypothetical protein